VSENSNESFNNKLNEWIENHNNKINATRNKNERQKDNQNHINGELENNDKQEQKTIDFDISTRN